MKYLVSLTFILFVFFLGQIVHAGMIGLDVNLNVPQAIPPVDSTKTVVDPGIEFIYDTLSWDFFDNGDVLFTDTPYIGYITYDAVFTITSPGVEFTGVSGLIGVDKTNYSVYFDSLSSSIVFHHEGPLSEKANQLYFSVTTSQLSSVPEPSTFLLLGGGLSCLVFVIRRRKDV